MPGKLNTALCAAAAFAAVALPVSSWAAPYDTGDPGTAEKYEFKTTYQQKRENDSRSIVGPKFELAAPLADNWEVSGTISQGWRRRDGVSTNGLRDMTLASKYRFYEGDADGWLPAMAIEPEISFPTGSHRKGLGESNARITLPLLLGKEFGRFELDAEIGYSRSLGKEADDEFPFGVLLTYKLTDTFSVGTEVAGSMPRQDTGAYDLVSNVGAKWKAAPNLTVYALVGRSIAGPGHGPSANSKLVVKFEF